MHTPNRGPAILLFLLLLGALAGCVTKQTGDYIPAWQENPTITRYFDAYGRDCLVEQSIENGTAYRTFTWPVQGIRVKTVLDSGRIVREESFEPGTSSFYRND